MDARGELVRYHALGVEELVVFFTNGKRGERLRVWDRIDGDLVERVVENEKTSCLTLGLHLVVATINGELEGPRGRARRAAEEAQRAAEERVRELEKQVAPMKRR